MHIFAPRQAEPDPENVLHLDEVARHRMLVLGVLLLLWLGASALVFVATDFGDLGANTTAVGDLHAGMAGERTQAELDQQVAVIKEADGAVRRGWGRLGGFMLAMLTIGYFLVLQRPRLRTQPEITNDNARSG